ncbi:MAG TPA: sugar nucleotide-binding protein [Chlamydiales bacterium]|nr:sugar nucleotide-binding protein [Chlamydiales bacterium]
MKEPGKTLVIGCEGFLGENFYNAYRKFYPDAIGTHYRSPDPARRMDLYHPDIAPLHLEKGEYSYALIAAANTNLALCEQEKGLPFRCNVEGVLRLVESLIALDIVPILFSTAYVFDGVEGNYHEQSQTCPINEYGKQKETVEKTIGKICGTNYLMIRSSKVFDLVKGSNTLIDQICSALIQQQRVRAAYDQIFCPLGLEDLVGGVIALQTAGCRGIYNLCGSEVWSRLALAEKIAGVLGVPSELIAPISLDEVQSSFRMPKRTNMCCEKFHNSVDFSVTSLSTYIKQLKNLYLPEEKHDDIREEVMG